MRANRLCAGLVSGIVGGHFDDTTIAGYPEMMRGDVMREPHPLVALFFDRGMVIVHAVLLVHWAGFHGIVLCCVLRLS
jgi:hypothetical protein